jgi:tetraacyldisaccharide 4'-kinase
MRFSLFPLAAIYGIFATLRNYFYDYGLLKISKVTMPVISVGNITTGGTGKTPMTIYLAEEAKARGFRPGIVSRGYGRNSQGCQIVHDGCEFKDTVENSGDEPYLMATLLKDVPVAVSENRVDGAEKLIQDYAVNLILVDDGFQHRSFFRDVNILLLNASEKKKAYHMLPMGVLREPLSNIQRADHIFITKGDRKNIPPKVDKYVDNILESTISYKLKKYMDGSLVDAEIPPFELFAFCGIAHPQLFFDSIRLYGIRVSNSLCFSDHVIYDKKTKSRITESILNKGKGLITTEKDLVKLSDSFLDGFDVYILTMDFNIPSSALDKIFNSP